MRKIRVIEVVSGLGLGGAEKGLISRLENLPQNFNSIVFNVWADLDKLSLPNHIVHKIISRKRKRLPISLAFNLVKSNSDFVVVRAPVDLIIVGYLKKLIPWVAWRLVFEVHSQIITTRGPILAKVMKFFLTKIANEVALTIAVSKSVARGDLASTQINIHVAYLGSNVEIDLSKIQSPKLPRFVFIGRLVDLKRPLWLIDRVLSIATKMPLYPGFLSIIGDGNLREILELRIRNSTIENFVTYYGEQNDIREFLYRSTHLISCSLTEGLPITFFEAKLAGLRIVCTPFGAGEVLDNDDFQSNSFAEDEFERALLTILSMPTDSLSRKLDLIQRNEKYNAKICSEKYYRLLERELSAKKI